MDRLPLQIVCLVGQNWHCTRRQEVAVEGRVMLSLANHEWLKRVLGSLAVAGLACVP